MRKNHPISRFLSLLLCLIMIMSIAPFNVFAADTVPVASITVGETTTTYTSFAAALAAANKANTDCTIKLLADTIETERLFYTGQKGQLTIDFGAYRLTCDNFYSGTTSSVKLTGTTGGITGTINFYGPSRAMGDTISMNLPDCIIESGVYYGTIHTAHLANVTINGGTFTSTGRSIEMDGGTTKIQDGTFKSVSGFVTNYNSISSPSLRIYGGTFELTNPSNAMLTKNGGSINLYGGTFKNGLKVSKNDLDGMLAYNYQYWINGVPQFLTEGQTEITGGDVIVDKAAVASVTPNGGTAKYYKTIASAVEDFNATGGTMMLLADVTAPTGGTGNLITLSLPKNSIFDLNGHTIKLSPTMIGICTGEKCCDLVVKDSSAAQTGKITGGSYSILNYGKGHVTITSGTYEAIGRGYTGSLFITGGVFDREVFLNNNNYEGSFTISGGTFNKGIRIDGGNQTVASLLADGKALVVNGRIYNKSEVSSYGSEFMVDSKVTVANEDDAAVKVTKGEETACYTTLNAALDGLASGKVTLLKDIDEDFSLYYDIDFDLDGYALSGIFTAVIHDGDIGSMNLIDDFPEDMEPLRVRIRDENGNPAYSTSIDDKTTLVINGLLSQLNKVAIRDEGVSVWGDGEKLHLLHEHEWKYTSSSTSNGQKITATCKWPNSCTEPENRVVASIELRNTQKEYTGDNITAELIRTETNYMTAPYLSDIQYYDAENKRLPTAPINAGTYTAKLSFGTETAAAALTIGKAVPAADMFKVDLPNEPVYDGVEKKVEVKPASGIVGMGELTVKYYDNEGNLLDEAPTDAGTYSVKLSVAENANCEGAEDLGNDAWTFTIERSPVTVTAVDCDKVYGEEDPVFAYTVSENTPLAENDTLIGVLNRNEGENADEYAITQGTLTNEQNPNYNITFIDGTFTIKAKEITAEVILSQSEFTYTGTVFEPTVTVMDGETEIPADEYTFTYTDNTLPGTATVTITDNGGGNYTVSGSTTFRIDLGTTTENVTPDDQETLEDVKGKLEDRIEQLPDGDEKDELQGIVDEIDEMLDLLGRVEEVEDLQRELPETALPDDEAALDAWFKAKDAYDVLSDYEKTLVDEALLAKYTELGKSLAAYKLTEGDGSTWTKKSGKDLTFTANGLYSKFTGVEIDGALIDEANYEAKSGSTIITLKDSYLETLKVGEHTISVVYPNGKASGTFTVKAAAASAEKDPAEKNPAEKDPAEKNPAAKDPDTGDNSTLLLWSILFAMSGAALIVLKRRKCAK